MNHIYGVISNGVHVDVSKTGRGAKNYATRHGYSQVSVRFNSGYNVAIIATRGSNGRWVAYDQRMTE